MKRYARFYQYTYVSIYRQLQAERKKAAEPEPVSFEPVSADQPFRLQYKKILNSCTIRKKAVLLQADMETIYFAGGCFWGMEPEEQQKYTEPMQVELLPLKNYYPADEYHQDYLNKHPDGYCHLPLDLFRWAKEQKEG